jgi:transposase
MDLNFRQFRKRLSRKLALIINRFRLLAAIEDRDFGSPRMCPFCGLITSRRKTRCLECGKSLKPA